MGLLRQHIAPLAPEAWCEIENTVRDVLRTRLSARRVVDVSGLHGLDTAAVGLGRLEVPKTKTKGTVGFGVHQVQPLVEVRAGFEPGGITGLTSLAENKPQKLDLEIQSFTGAVSTALLQLKDRAVGGPYALVLGPEASRWLDSQACGYPLRRQIADILDGDIIYSPVCEGGLLISLRGGDFELTLGQDLAQGYDAHGDEKVKLFITESFTFRVIEPGAAVRLQN